MNTQYYAFDDDFVAVGLLEWCGSALDASKQLCPAFELPLEMLYHAKLQVILETKLMADNPADAAEEHSLLDWKLSAILNQQLRHILCTAILLQSPELNKQQI